MKPGRALVALLLLLLLAGGLHAMIGVQRTDITTKPPELRDGGDDGNGTDGDPWQDDDKGNPNGSSIIKRFIVIGVPTNPFAFLNAWYVRVNTEIRNLTSPVTKSPTDHRSKRLTK